jgi:recombinational DNA repair ATPase RecF
MTILERDIANLGKEIIDQRKAYLHQVEVVARELGRLASVSDRTLGLLTDTEADAQLLDAVHQKANDILALQRQLRELWAPFLTQIASRGARVRDDAQPQFAPIPANSPRTGSSR